jgi:hypothetical protein
MSLEGTLRRTSSFEKSKISNIKSLDKDPSKSTFFYELVEYSCNYTKEDLDKIVEQYPYVTLDVVSLEEIKADPYLPDRFQRLLLEPLTRDRCRRGQEVHQIDDSSVPGLIVKKAGRNVLVQFTGGETKWVPIIELQTEMSPEKIGTIILETDPGHTQKRFKKSDIKFIRPSGLDSSKSRFDYEKKPYLCNFTEENLHKIVDGDPYVTLDVELV